jgi:hypothetical protein
MIISAYSVISSKFCVLIFSIYRNGAKRQIRNGNRKLKASPTDVLQIAHLQVGRKEPYKITNSPFFC